MKERNFQYKDTCPTIWGGAEKFKEEIGKSLDLLIKECCPLLEGEAKQDLINHHVICIHNSLEYIFEDVYRSNTEMRDAANTQIRSLYAQNEALQNEIEELNYRIINLWG